MKCKFSLSETVISEKLVRYALIFSQKITVRES